MKRRKLSLPGGKSKTMDEKKHSRFHNHCRQQQPKRLPLNCWLFSSAAFSVSRPLWHSTYYLMTEFQSSLMKYCRDCCYCSSLLIESHWFDCSMASIALEDSLAYLRIPCWFHSGCWAFSDTWDGGNVSLRVRKSFPEYEVRDLPFVADIGTYTWVKNYCNKVHRSL